MSLFLALLAVTAAPAPTPAISVSTALLLIAVGLLVLRRQGHRRPANAEVQRPARAAHGSASFATAEHASPATSAAPEAIDSTLRAVIAAAVHTAMADQPYRIVAVAQSAHDAGWSLEGRRQVFQSHQVR
jgi:hypothetical protein